MQHEDGSNAKTTQSFNPTPTKLQQLSVLTLETLFLPYWTLLHHVTYENWRVGKVYHSFVVSKQ